MALINCPECGHQVSNTAKSCPNCGTPIDTAMHCPKCGSTNVKTISGASKVVSIWAWGIFSANKVLSKFQCKDCKFKF